MEIILLLPGQPEFSTPVAEVLPSGQQPNFDSKQVAGRDLYAKRKFQKYDLIKRLYSHFLFRVLTN